MYIQLYPRCFKFFSHFFFPFCVQAVYKENCIAMNVSIAVKTVFSDGAENKCGKHLSFHLNELLLQFLKL